MARKVKRNVKRMGTSGRQAVVQEYSARRWYDLPYWAKDWLYSSSGWVILALAVILAPPALLALVLGFHALPLEFLGIPASENGVGLAAGVLLLKFIFVALAVRPLLNQQLKGWRLLIAAAIVHLAHSIILQHAITGAALLLLAIYLYFQVKGRYQEA
jgi:hypothetical protein